MAPVDAVSWYAGHGYDFLALSDHGVTSIAEAPALSTPDAFTVIASEEVSSTVPSTRPREIYPRDTISVHVNTLCTTATAAAVSLPTVAEALRATVANARAVAPLIQINHPNYEGALSFRDFDGIEGPYLLEVANGHPHVDNDGMPIWPDYDLRPTAEQLWDALLTRGVVVYGTATDDTHDFVRDPGFTPRRPGHGWVMVASESSEASDICDALGRGRFYASNGVEISSIVADEARGSLSMEVAASTPEEQFITRFVGANGRTLALQNGLSPFYVMRPGDSYVRAVVTSTTTLKSAWVQPLFQWVQPDSPDQSP